MTREAWIVAAARTPIGRAHKGALGEQRGRLGLATLCVGGGQGMAAVVQLP